MNNVLIWADEPHASAIAAANGAGAMLKDVSHCVLNVGDTLSLPENPSIAYKVVSRHWHSGPEKSVWVLKVEPVPHPVAS